MDCSPPGSSAHGILQARILEGVETSFSRGSSQTRDLCVSCVSCIGRRLPYDCTTWEAPDSRLQRDTKLDSSFCCNRAEPCPSSQCPKVPLCPLPLVGRKADSPRPPRSRESKCKPLTTMTTGSQAECLLHTPGLFHRRSACQRGTEPAA